MFNGVGVYVGVALGMAWAVAWSGSGCLAYAYNVYTGNNSLIL